MNESTGTTNTEWLTREDAGSGERFRALARTVDGDVCLIDADYRVIGVNRGLLDITGYERNDVLGNPLTSLFGEAILDFVQTLRDEPPQQPTDAKARRRKLQLETQGDTTVACTVRATPVTPEKDRQQTVCLIQPESPAAAQDRALDRYRQLFTESPDVNAILNADGTFQYLPPATADVLGYAPDELIGENTFDYVHPDDHDRVWDTFTHLIENPEAEPTVELRYRHADGHWIVMEAHGLNLLDDPALEGIVAYTRDVTERVQREQQLETLMENIPGMVYRCRNDVGWPMVFVSEGSRDVTGYTPDAIVDGDVSFGHDIVADRDRERIHSEVQQGIEENGEFLITYRIETASGDMRWVKERGQVMKATSGTTELLEGVIIDVTERKRLEAELDEILGRISDAFYALDEHWQITHANEQARELLEYPGMDIVGETLWDVLEMPNEATLRSEYESAMARQEPTSFEFHIPGPRDAWYEVRAFPSDTGLSVYFRDITNRKRRERALEESERRYRTLAEHFPNGAVGVYDHDLTFTLTRGAMLGEQLPSADDLEGYRMPDVFPPEAVTDLEPLYRSALDTGETAQTVIEFNDRQWRVWATPLRDGNDDIFAGLSFAQNITEQVERQERLEELIADLEESNKRLEQFAYAASHDLQEPLRMVSSYLQLIDERYAEELDSDGQEFIQYAVDGADRMREMIDALLEYSRVETRGDPLASVNLNTVITEVLEDLALQIQETDADITTHASLPTVRGDASQLRQVFQNLLDNAIEYSGDNPPEIEIDVSSDDDEWIISIADGGIGIPSDDIERVFQVFKRLHTYDEHAGTGIGLALCRRIIERHDGDIWVESEPGEGSTFYVSLPRPDTQDT